MLTKEERQRFVEWLKKEIQSNEALIRQMETMPGMNMEVIRHVKRTEMHAAQVVLSVLRSIED